MARGIRERLAVLALLQQRLRDAHLAGDDDAVGGGQRLAGDADLPGVHAGLLGLAIDQIDDLVGDAVANLVRMAFGNGFAGEQVILARHGCPLLKRIAGMLPVLALTRVNATDRRSSRRHRSVLGTGLSGRIIGAAT